MENTTLWKKEFRHSTKKKKRVAPPLNVNEEKLIFPPLQTIYEIPPYKSPLSQEPFIGEPEPFIGPLPKPIVEGMDTKKGAAQFKAAVLSAGNAIKKARTYIYDQIYEGCYWFVKEDIQLLNSKTHKETPTENEIKQDASYLQTFIILLLIIPLCVYSTYNWYYLLFFQEGLATPMNFDNSSLVSNPIVSFFLEFVLVPVQLLDLLLFKWIPSFDSTKNWSPLQSVNFILVLCFIVLFFINYMENQGFNIALLCFVFAYAMGCVYALSVDNKYLFYGMLFCIVPILSALTMMGSVLGEVVQLINIEAIIYLLVICAWGKWAFLHCVSISTTPVPPSLVMLILHGLYILIRLIISISLIPLAMMFLNVYILVNSFLGVMRFEKNWISVIQGIIPYIRRNDKEFYKKHGLESLQFLNNFIYGRFVWVGWIVLCVFYLLQMPSRISSFNLKHTLALFLVLLITIFLSILYLFKPSETCGNIGGNTKQPEQSEQPIQVSQSEAVPQSDQPEALSQPEAVSAVPQPEQPEALSQPEAVSAVPQPEQPEAVLPQPVQVVSPAVSQSEAVLPQPVQAVPQPVQVVSPAVSQSEAVLPQPVQAVVPQQFPNPFPSNTLTK
jgi:hypothetical protein